jgi:hypothetical protein
MDKSTRIEIIHPAKRRRSMRSTHGSVSLDYACVSALWLGSVLKPPPNLPTTALADEASSLW